MTKQNFIFGGDTGLTQAEIKRQRAAMDAQNARNTRPRTIGQGISAIGQALGQNIERGRLDRADKANKERAATRSKKIMQGLVANKYGNGSLSDIMDALNDDYTPPAQKHVFQMLMERKLRPPAPRRTIQGVDGRQYYMDTQEPVLPGVERPAEPTPLMRNYQTAVDGGFEGNIVDYQLALRQPQQRQIIKGADGFQRDVNTGERIFPDAERHEKPTAEMQNHQYAEKNPDFAKQQQEEGGFTTRQKLRKEYEGINSVQSFRKQQSAYQRVLDSAQNASPAGDLALVFNYMKVLDPGSVVRESEFATAAASGSYGERVGSAINRILNGQRLTAEMRRDFVDRAGRLYSGAAELHGINNSRYGELATQANLRPDDVIFPPAPIGVLSDGWDIDNFLGTIAGGAETDLSQATDEELLQSLGQ